MLTRFVRTQLIIFTTASVIGIAVMLFGYMQLPTLLGIGRITVTLELPGAGGLYRFGNVTYLGSQVGRVIAIEPTSQGAKATLSLGTSPRIPADLQAQVRSVSAVGEQYVELRPRTDSGPYLQDGSVISVRDTKDSLAHLLDESSLGLGGAGYDLGSLIDSSARVAGDLSPVAEQSRRLVEDTGPLLDSQVQTSDSVRLWARSLAGVSTQLTTDDTHIRKLLQDGPGAAQEVTRLFDQVKPTLPVLLANLSSVGQVGVTYHASLEQVLVLLPPLTAMFIGAGPYNNYVGMGLGDFRLTQGDPPPCTVGYLPPNQWRSPADTTPVDTPDGLYCKLPQDAPIAVRGARNYPCMGVPGKRAPTVELCNSDKPYEPIAQRQHVLGPYPLDPNLIAQGVPPDWRVDQNDHLYGPVEGTPPPPTAAPADQPQASTTFGSSGSNQNAPVAFARYDPGSGKYMAPDGHVYEQRDLVTAGRAHTWQQLVLPP
jgi:phospholipid/cholesterol/gamma-HCH transport system substrate-binding protein